MEQEEYRKLRDRFAAYALTAMVDKANHCLVFGRHDELAKNCYRIAHALMDVKLKIEYEEEKALKARSDATRRDLEEEDHAFEVLDELFQKLAAEEPTHAKDGTKAKYFIRYFRDIICVNVWWNGFEWDYGQSSCGRSLEGFKVLPEASVPSREDRVRMYYEAAKKSKIEKQNADFERRKKEFEARKSRKMMAGDKFNTTPQKDGDT